MMCYTHGNEKRTSLASKGVLSVTSGFQSTHPMRGETIGHCRTLAAKKFQSTHPMRGETMSSLFNFPHHRFQSTHPMRGETPLQSHTGH